MRSAALNALTTFPRGQSAWVPARPARKPRRRRMFSACRPRAVRLQGRVAVATDPPGRHRAIGERSAADRPNASRPETRNSQGEALGVWRSTDRRPDGIGQRGDQCSMMILDHPRPTYARSDTALARKRGNEFFFLARVTAQTIDKARFAERNGRKWKEMEGALGACLASLCAKPRMCCVF